MKIREIRLIGKISDNVVYIKAGKERVEILFDYKRRIKGKVRSRSYLLTDNKDTIKLEAMAIQVHLDGSKPASSATQDYAELICTELVSALV